MTHRRNGGVTATTIAQRNLDIFVPPTLTARQQSGAGAVLCSVELGSLAAESYTPTLTLF